MALFAKLKIYSPDFKGPIKTKEGVKLVLALVEKASVEDGYAGAFLSHNGGNKYIWGYLFQLTIFL